MNIAQFLKNIEAEIVGGRVKAVIDGVHHFVADLVEGNPVLTAAGAAAKDELESRAPDVAKVVAAAPAAAAEVASIVADPAIAGVASGGLGGVAEAVAKPVAEKAAVDAVDAVLDGIASAATKKPAAK